MLYIIVIVVLLALAYFYKIGGKLRQGQEVINAISQNRNGPKNSMQSLIYDWLNASPSRMRQRELYLGLLSSLGWSEGRAIDEFMHCVVHSWGKNDPPFGRVLVDSLNRCLRLDDPTTWADAKGNKEMLMARETGIALFRKYEQEILSFDKS